MKSPFSLEGKTILVTGATSGIGRGIAISCSRMGAQLVLNGRDLQGLLDTKLMLEGIGHQAFSADLTDQDGINALSNHVPCIDGVVFCSGVLDLCTTKTVNEKTLSHTMSINAFAPILLISSLLKKRKLVVGSSCVVISSLSGVFLGGTGEVAYSASKGALSGYVKTAALELATKRIRINAVCPALVPTKLSQQYESFVSEDFFQTSVTNYPLKRLGTPEDIAYPVVFLLSEASSWITGINLVVDGGLTIK